jgi:hypothetical protein
MFPLGGSLWPVFSNGVHFGFAPGPCVGFGGGGFGAGGGFPTAATTVRSCGDNGVSSACRALVHRMFDDIDNNVRATVGRAGPDLAQRNRAIQQMAEKVQSSLGELRELPGGGDIAEERARLTMALLVQLHSGDESSSSGGDGKDKQCTICMEPLSRDILPVPCGHHFLCDGCASKVTECPICRSAITLRQPIYG